MNEHAVGHELQGSLQVGQRDMLADDQTLALHELMGMRRIVIVSAVYLARADQLDRKLAMCLLEFSHLHGLASSKL